MRFSRSLVFLAFLGLAACGGEEAVKPDAQPSEAPPAAETRGLDQNVPEGKTAGDDSAAQAEAGQVVHFAFDSASVDSEGRAIIEANARMLVSNPNARVTLEGHTDERGTREYNLALGERRAKSVERMMKAIGVTGDRISTTSYGEEKPVATGQSESAWQQNRRVQIIIK